MTRSTSLLSPSWQRTPLAAAAAASHCPTSPCCQPRCSSSFSPPHSTSCFFSPSPECSSNQWGLRLLVGEAWSCHSIRLHRHPVIIISVATNGKPDVLQDLSLNDFHWNVAKCWLMWHLFNILKKQTAVGIPVTFTIYKEQTENHVLTETQFMMSQKSCVYWSNYLWWSGFLSTYLRWKTGSETKFYEKKSVPGSDEASRDAKAYNMDSTS